MDSQSTHESVPDSAYDPQVINEQDAPVQNPEVTTQHPTEQQNINTPSMTTSPPQDHETNSRYNSPTVYQQPASRPGSGMGGVQQSYQDRQAPQNKSSVVIKVGMVGDAQIGKTSLMVKYVEGSWDEDYIQTLGM